MMALLSTETLTTSSITALDKPALFMQGLSKLGILAWFGAVVTARYDCSDISTQSIMSHAFPHCECLTSSMEHQVTLCCTINGKARPSPVEHRRSPHWEADQHTLQLQVPAQVLQQ